MLRLRAATHAPPPDFHIFNINIPPEGAKHRASLEDYFRAKTMLVSENLVLTRAEPNGCGGLQFLYRVKNYGIAASSHPKEEIAQINWEVDVIKYRAPGTLAYDICHSTELAGKTLSFHNDKSLNEFLAKAFNYFKELNLLEEML